MRAAFFFVGFLAGFFVGFLAGFFFGFLAGFFVGFLAGFFVGFWVGFLFFAGFLTLRAALRVAVGAVERRDPVDRGAITSATASNVVGPMYVGNIARRGLGAMTVKQHRQNRRSERFQHQQKKYAVGHVYSQMPPARKRTLLRPRSRLKFFKKPRNPRTVEPHEPVVRTPAARKPAGVRTFARGVGLTHLGSGKYSDVFRVHARKPTRLVMKVSYYRDATLCDVVKKLKAGDANGALESKRRDAIQVSHAFSRVTSALLDSVSPHFVVVYCQKDCMDFAPKLGPLLKQRLTQLTAFQRKFNNVCFMELFRTNLTAYLVTKKYTETTLKGIVFQVVYTLAALQRALPGFRHNDLSTNNILVRTLAKPPALAYTVTTNSPPSGALPPTAPPGVESSTTYYVSVPVFVALSDYDFVHVPKHPELSNERVLGGRYRVDGRPNDSYDTHFFLKSVLKCIQRRTAEFPETVRFLYRARLKTEDRQNSTVMARLRPETLLKDPYFDSLKMPLAGVRARYSV